MLPNAKNSLPNSRGALAPQAERAERPAALETQPAAVWRRSDNDRPVSRPAGFAPESRFNRPTVAEIDLDALVHNLGEVRRLAPLARILAVVKANAYGHGAVQVALALEAAGVDFFGVSLIEEGSDLRQAGVRGDILTLGAAYSDYGELVANDLIPLVFTAEHLVRLQAAAARAGRIARAHLKLDTGMGRLGLMLEELPEFLEALRDAPNVRLDGLVSHLANADAGDLGATRRQIARFRVAAAAIRTAGFPIPWRHISNSAGAIDLDEVKDGAEFNLVRPGLILYGEYPAERLRSACQLEPVLSWKTSITHLKRVGPGVPISYGGTWTTRRDSLIATLPVGYADGWPRRLSNRGEVLVRGRRTPVVGNVCMDMCMVDVTDVPGVALHDEVVLLGRQGREAITAQEMAERCETIPYEILTSVGARVPRVAVQKALTP